MIKSDRSRPAVPAKPLILYGILKGIFETAALSFGMKSRARNSAKRSARGSRCFVEMVTLVAALYLTEEKTMRTALAMVRGDPSPWWPPCCDSVTSWIRVHLKTLSVSAAEVNREGRPFKQDRKYLNRAGSDTRFRGS